MSEENETAEDEIFEEDATDTPEEEEKGHGPGFRLGILVGLIVGTAVAILFAPPTGEEDQGTDTSDAPTGSTSASSNSDVGSAFGRISTMLDQVRGRVREASREAGSAARETEELAQARFAELTHQDGSSNE